VTVIADRGLGIRGLGRAVKSSRVQHVVGIRSATIAARTLRWAPRASVIDLKSLQSSSRIEGLIQLGRPDPEHDDLAAILFTSGATGPAKGVRYTHGELCAQRDILQRVYNITDTDSFVAAFAPFALFGPALGITTGLADMDVTSPATLTAKALEDACSAIRATMVFASPAALANVLATSSPQLQSLGQVRLVMSAGAPVPIGTLREMKQLCPIAELHTPYGMTEVLPVADLSLEQREVIGEGRGVCVGKPVDGCQVKVVAIQGTSNALPNCSYVPGVQSANLQEVLPKIIFQSLQKGFLEFNKKLKGYVQQDAIVVATESRTSAPVRIPRDADTLQHLQIKGLYPCGEGAGYAGGIVSAGMDGEKVALAVYQNKMNNQ
jgi:acyl-CoA synthetase (AMP-forming)/AMP-acid ligase II